MGWGFAGSFGLGLWCARFGHYEDADELIEFHHERLWVTLPLTGQPWPVRR